MRVIVGILNWFRVLLETNGKPSLGRVAFWLTFILSLCFFWLKGRETPEQFFYVFMSLLTYEVFKKTALYNPPHLRNNGGNENGTGVQPGADSKS